MVPVGGGDAVRVRAVLAVGDRATPGVCGLRRPADRAVLGEFVDGRHPVGVVGHRQFGVGGGHMAGGPATGGYLSQLGAAASAVDPESGDDALGSLVECI